MHRAEKDEAGRIDVREHRRLNYDGRGGGELRRAKVEQQQGLHDLAFE
jgi:hypothetical protein